MADTGRARGYWPVSEAERSIITDPAVRERFWRVVDKTGECWLWTGQTAVAANSRKPHCVNGHDLSVHGRYEKGKCGRPNRFCRACATRRQAARRQRRRAARREVA